MIGVAIIIRSKRLLRVISDWKHLYQSVFIIILFVSTWAGLIVALVEYRREWRLSKQLVEDAKESRDFISVHLYNYDFFALETVAKTLEDREEIAFISVMTDDHAIVYGEAITPKSNYDIEVYEFTLFDPPQKGKNKEIIGYIKLGIIKPLVSIMLRKAITTASAIFIIILVPAFLCTFIFVTRSIIHPLEMLSLAVYQTARTGTPVQTSFVEENHFGRFALSFNQMQLKLKQVKNDLERSVKQLTMERRVNIDLNRILDSVLNASGQSVSHFSIKGQSSEMILGNKETSVFRDIRPKLYRTNLAISKALRKNHFNPIHHTQGASEDVLFDIEYTREDNRVIRVLGLNLKETGYAIVSSDVTETERMEAILRQSQKMEAIGSLTNGVAHDFNNILAIISANTEFLLGESVLEEHLQRHLSDTLDATQRGKSIVDSLLAFSRKKPVEVQTTSTKTIMTRISRILPLSLGSNYQVIEDYEADYFIHVNEGILETAILNLILNARDAMPEGGQLKIEIVTPTKAELARLNLKKSGRYLGIRVSDEGTGIADDIYDQLLDPFFTTKPSGKGTGLGLPLVYSCACQFGGGLYYNNLPDRGAVFMIVLPISEASSQSPLVSNSPPLMQEPKQARVIILEDETALCNVLTLALQRINLEVISFGGFESFRDYIENVAELDVDLIISDYNLKDGTALDVVQALEGQQYNRNVMLISGNMALSQLPIAKRDYFVDAMLKPFSIREFSERVSKILDRV